MTLDKQLFASVQQRQSDAPNRFKMANTALMVPSDRAGIAKVAGEPKAKPGGIRFYMPPAVDQLIDELVTKAGLAGHRSNRSEVVRAGIQLLQRLEAPDFVAALRAEQETQVEHERTSDSR